jgi:HSP20 family protein
MWEEEENSPDIFGEMEKQARQLLDETYSSSIHWLFDLGRKSVKPLHRIDIVGREVVVTFDLPGVEKKDVSLSVAGDILSIEAKMKQPVLLMVGGTLQKHVQFEKYWKRIKLPVRVDLDKAKAKMKNGLLTVRFPSVRHTAERTIDIE